MAGKSSSFLNSKDREKLLKEVGDEKESGKPSANSGSENGKKTAAAPNVPNSGCYVCKLDNDHAHLLLCEGCPGEYHIYCLKPKLKAVPKDDWFCAACKPKLNAPEGDGLELLVAALPPSYSSRFGEIVWAQGGVGYGYWPSCIYDPQHTIGSARQEARKNLGKKHLVFFFDCRHAPFAVLSDNKIMSWEEGLTEDFHLGRAAKSHGKARLGMFQHALCTATTEFGKPVHQRLDWNHTGQQDDAVEFLPSPVKSPSKKKRKKDKKRDRKRSREKDAKDGDDQQAGKKRAATKDEDEDPSALDRKPRANLNAAFVEADNATTTVEQAVVDAADQSQMYCNVVVQGIDKPLGFIVLPSRASSTFADTRKAIQSQNLPIKMDYRFVLPSLGPMTLEQESLVGPMLPLVESDPGSGSLTNPVKVIVTEAPSVPVHHLLA